ncbi:MAG TPA: NAD(P)/FAD-dependent oxidoreductase [Candidatus Saccharimonadales bacterium]|nr:NAD(P)/FAD-dependent oxidoreductase [Candidatus Saccharimonadales bacterium]
MKDGVAIIGAGTAGLIAAKALAGLGVQATVYDQKRVLGKPVRASGILSIKGLEELGIDYRRAVTNTLYGARIHAGGRSFTIRAGREVAHVLDRKELNDLCHDEAVAGGAEVVLGERINGQRLEELSGSGIIVGADGAVSEVARHFGMGGIRNYVITYKAEFELAPEDPGLVDLFFDNRVSRGLFGWFSPNSKDLLEVGIGLDSRNGNAKSAFKAFVSGPYVSGILGSSKMVTEGASIIPMGLRRRIVDEKRRVLLVGDAAGQVKPSTGGGIIFGGNAAIMAAGTIKRHIDGGSALSDYEAAYNRKYWIDTALHSLANSVYSRLGSRSLGLAIDVLNAVGIDSFLGRYGDMDMPSMILRNALLGNSPF